MDRLDNFLAAIGSIADSLKIIAANVDSKPANQADNVDSKPASQADNVDSKPANQADNVDSETSSPSGNRYTDYNSLSREAILVECERRGITTKGKTGKGRRISTLVRELREYDQSADVQDTPGPVNNDKASVSPADAQDTPGPADVQDTPGPVNNDKASVSPAEVQDTPGSVNNGKVSVSPADPFGRDAAEDPFEINNAEDVVYDDLYDAVTQLITLKGGITAAKPLVMGCIKAVVGAEMQLGDVPEKHYAALMAELKSCM